MKSPTLSVVMPVYNGQTHLGEAIDSVLNQTFTDFELIIIDDGSTDKTSDVIQGYDDERIIYITNEENKGIPYCRNLGLKLGKGEFLAWADSDDINEDIRFDEQIRFLNQNNEVGVCGACISRFGMESYVSHVDEDPEVVKATLLFKPSLRNPAVMLRLSKIKQYGLVYDNTLSVAEDYEFFFQCSLHFLLGNIKKVLCRQRASPTSIMGIYRSDDGKRDEILKIVHRRILTTMGIVPSESELAIHRSISSNKLFNSMADYKKAYHWLILLELQNNERGLYQESAFKKVLRHQFYFISKKASQLGLSVLLFYLNQSRKRFGYIDFYKLCKLSVRCLIKYNKF